MHIVLARFSLVATFPLMFLRVFPTSVGASLIISSNKITSNHGHDVTCFLHEPQSTTGALLPWQCQEALLKFYISIVSSATSTDPPIFTTDQSKMDLPDHYLVPRHTSHQACAVTVYPYGQIDAQINMGAFYQEGNKIIEKCVKDRAEFDGGEIVMNGEGVGQAVIIHIEHVGPRPVVQGPTDTTNPIPFEWPNPSAVTQNSANTTISSALARRTYSNRNYSPTCYLRGDNPHPLSLIPAHCKAALHSFLAHIPASNNPTFTRDEGKARYLPGYFLIPTTSKDEECMMKVSLGLWSTGIDVVIDKANFVSAAGRIIDQCVGKWPFDGGWISMDGIGPNQKITIHFQHLGIRAVGQSLESGSDTNIFELSPSSSFAEAVPLPSPQTDNVLATDDIRRKIANAIR